MNWIKRGAELAAITHGHSLGYMPAAVFTHIINRIVYGDKKLTLDNFDDALKMLRIAYELIKKLTGMASEYEAREMKRQVVVQGRIKTMNESIYYIADEMIVFPKKYWIR